MLRACFSALLVCTYFAPFVAATQQPTSSLSGLVKSSVDAVVLIVLNDENGKPIAEGSGFIVSADGRIVTNHHVLSGAHSATVKLNSGAFFPVDGILADDADHDLCVIKVSGKNLPTLALANSDGVSVGDHVVAIGSPLGLENSVTDGIVSAVRVDPKGRQWIQTTAPASHGNSGGPLLLLDGKVAGVLTWKAIEGENLNFASPSNVVAPLLTSSAIRPLGTSVTVDRVESMISAGERIWTSMTSGRDFKVRVEGDYVYIDWVLPSALQQTPAFMRYELKKNGNKWVGKVRAYLPHEYKSGYFDFWKTGQTMGTANVNWCSQESEVEIDSILESRIEGRALGSATFDAKKCKPGKLEWSSFTWIPK